MWPTKYCDRPIPSVPNNESWLTFPMTSHRLAVATRIVFMVYVLVYDSSSSHNSNIRVRRDCSTINSPHGAQMSRNRRLIYLDFRIIGKVLETRVQNSKYSAYLDNGFARKIMLPNNKFHKVVCSPGINVKYIPRI